MMESSIRLGKWFGIEVGMNLSLLLIGGLITFSMADGYYPDRLPDRPQNVYLLLGVVTSVLFFASILWHEFAHAFMAKVFRIPVKRIVLNFFGGVAEIEGEPQKGYQELWIALVGPLSTAALGMICLGASTLFESPSIPRVMLAWLGMINLILAALNMIPGFPLDGGRVLRALIWMGTGNRFRATRWAVRVGQVFAVGFACFGLFEIMILGSLFSGLWTIFIAWFLWSAGQSHLTFAHRQRVLEDIPIRALVRPRARLHPDWSVVYALDVMSMNGGGNVAPVIDHNQLVGIFSLESLIRLPRISWGTMRVSNLMKSSANIPHVSIHSTVFDALLEMERQEAQFALVTNESEMVGIASRYDLVKLAQNYHKLPHANQV
jgi:Zn-dependent protease